MTGIWTSNVAGNVGEHTGIVAYKALLPCLSMTSLMVSANDDVPDLTEALIDTVDAVAGTVVERDGAYLTRITVVDQPAFLEVLLARLAFDEREIAFGLKSAVAHTASGNEHDVDCMALYTALLGALTPRDHRDIGTPRYRGIAERRDAKTHWWPATFTSDLTGHDVSLKKVMHDAWEALGVPVDRKYHDAELSVWRRVSRAIDEGEPFRRNAEGWLLP